MSKIVIASLSAAALFFGVLLCLRIGWRVGRRRLAELGENSHAGLGSVEGMVFAMVGLLIAFTFTGAANRFDARRDLISEQVNAIGTAWLRLDLLEPSAGGALRTLFREYVDGILAVGDSAAVPEAVVRRLAEVADTEARIWNRCMEAVRADPGSPLVQGLLPSVNAMFDATQMRVLTARHHPPLAIYLMLGFLILVSALLAGFAMARTPRQSPLHVVGFASVMALSVYLILDLEYPRLGLIQIGKFDQALRELRASMDAAGGSSGALRK